jgi:endonuclease/exonuclease/phosphatase (EEP) superfamily protein YafD
LLLGGWAGIFRRRWIGFPLLGLLWVTGPLMGFRWHLSTRVETPVPRARLMTYNVKWGKRDLGAILSEVVQADPDLLALQDTNETVNRFIKMLLPGRYTFSSGQYFIASRWPLTNAETRPLASPDGRSTPSSYLYCRVRMGRRDVTFCDVHLLTPREGLTAVKNFEGGGFSDLAWNSRVRFHQAMSLAMDLDDETGPLLLAGDLNSPVQSLTCRALLKLGLQDAFSAAGRGYGYTYGRFTPLRHPFLRIDHILASPHWRIEACRAGNVQGSDHRPVVADLALVSP